MELEGGTPWYVCEMGARFVLPVQSQVAKAAAAAAAAAGRWQEVEQGRWSF